MKLLIYAVEFLPSVGGAEALTLALARGLTGRSVGRDNIEVTVATKRAAGGFDDRTLPFRVVRRPGLTALLRLLRGADLIHLAGPCFLPMLFGWLLRKPVIVEHHNFQAICPNGELLFEPTQTPCPGHFMAGRHRECLRCNASLGTLVSWKMWLLTFPRRWLCHQVAGNVALTRWLETLLELPRSNTVYIGVAGRPGSLAGKMLRPPLTFAYVGRLVSCKGVEILLQAAHRMKVRGLAFQLKIIGEGPQRRRLEEQAESLQLGDCASFLGYLPPNTAEETLAEVAAIVMPSLGGETFGLVAAENMMQGRLLIVSDLGALAEVVGPTGLKFLPGDVEGLSACLEQVLKSPRIVDELGQRARNRALQLFPEGRMIDDHVTLYRKLLSNWGRPC